MLGGCGSPESEKNGNGLPESKHIVVLAIDTSGSASKIKESLCKRASQDFFATRDNDEVVIYRFDNEPAEIYSGDPPGSEEQAAAKLKSLLPFSQKGEGTNLLKLVEKIDELYRSEKLPMKIFIYTDCGFEEMSNLELDKCKEITSAWGTNHNDIEVDFVGVTDGFREKLRKLVALPRSRIQFLE